MKKLLMLALACSLAGFVGDEDDNDDGPILPKELTKLRAYEAAKATGKPTYVFIYSDACQVCKRTAPAVWTVARRYSERFGFIFYEVNKNNKPDPTVEGKYQIVGTDTHHRTILDTPEVPGGNRDGGEEDPDAEARNAQRSGKLEIVEEKTYEEYLAAIATAYQTWVDLRVRRAYETWTRQQEGKERAAGKGGGKLPRTTGGAAAQLLEDPFKEIAEPEAVAALFTGMEQSKWTPVEPLNCVNKISGFKFKATQSEWDDGAMVLVGTWKNDHDKRRIQAETADAHKEVKDRIKEIGDDDRYVVRSAYLELNRLTGQEIAADHWGEADAKKASQKEWNGWYGDHKKKLDWDDEAKKFTLSD